MSPGIGSVPVRVIVTGVPALVERGLLSEVGWGSALTVIVTVAILLSTPPARPFLVVASYVKLSVPENPVFGV